MSNVAFSSVFFTRLKEQNIVKVPPEVEEIKREQEQQWKSYWSNDEGGEVDNEPK